MIKLKGEEIKGEEMIERQQEIKRNHFNDQIKNDVKLTSEHLILGPWNQCTWMFMDVHGCSWMFIIK